MHTTNHTVTTINGKEIKVKVSHLGYKQLTQTAFIKNTGVTVTYGGIVIAKGEVNSSNTTFHGKSVRLRVHNKFTKMFEREDSHTRVVNKTINEITLKRGVGAKYSVFKDNKGYNFICPL